jgi:hypothetical protein
LARWPGALGPSGSTWVAQSHQDRRDLFARRIACREQLYSELICKSARVMADAARDPHFQDPGKLKPLFALISRM